MIYQLAKFQVEVFNMQHESIGSLYTEQSFKIDRIVTMPFCMRDRVQFNGVNRGPFKSSREWLRAQLDIIQLECEHHLEKDDEDDEDDDDDDDDDDEDSSEEEEDTLQARSKLIKRLILLLPKFIPKTDDSFVE